MDMFLVAIILIVILVLLAMSIKIANQWERVVVLYLGKFVGIGDPGCSLLFLS